MVMRVLNSWVYAFFLVSVLLFSCSTERNKVVKNDPTIVDVDHNVKNLMDKIALRQVIPLGLSDSTAISSWFYVKKIFQINGDFYVLDARYMNISVFDSTGSYKFKLGKLGSKTGQFSNVQDMTYRPDRKSILVLCNTPNKIIEFSLAGTFMKEYYPTFFSSSIEIENADNYYLYTNANHTTSSQKMDLLRTDSLLRIKSRLFDPKAGQNSSFASYGGLFKSESDKIYFNRPYERDIYQMKGGNAHLTYRVDFGKADNIDSVDFGAVDTYLKTKSYLSNKLFFTDDYVGLNYQKRGRSNFCLYEPKTRSVYSTDFPESPVMLFTQGVFWANGKLIVMFSPKSKRKLIEEHRSEILTAYPELADALDPASNNGQPYLLVFDITR